MTFADLAVNDRFTFVDHAPAMIVYTKIDSKHCVAYLGGEACAVKADREVFQPELESDLAEAEGQ
jgi:hypothetical protein